MQRPQINVIAGFLLVCALAVGLTSTRALSWLDHSVYDLQVRWLQKHANTALAQDVVVIGLDEAALESLAEPMGLWHKHLGLLLGGLAAARPSVVGIAAPLPVRSYEFLVKGIDKPLLEGILQLKSTTPLVVGQAKGLGSEPRPIATELLAALGPGALTSLTLCEDSDGVLRRIGQQDCGGLDATPAFAGAMASALGMRSLPAGHIDYSAGPKVNYIPVQTVLDWIRQSNQAQLKNQFGGRAVIVASILPTDTRMRLPVPLTAWDPVHRTAPADIVQVQVLRSLLGRGLMESTSIAISALLAGLAALLWFGRNSGWKFFLFVLFEVALLVGGTYALWQGKVVGTGSLMAAMLLAFLSRLVWESIRHYREKSLLRSAFAGHVSPQVMRAILNGKLQPDGEGEVCKATMLFADIRGFTTRSESSTPEATIALLNQYYAETSAAIHGKGGAIDKFIGDGLMATFGVPQPLNNPARSALEAAQDMLVRIARLNKNLEAQGLAPIEIGIGIHSGDVIAGYVGSRKRRDFTVIGDAVNTASRLESMTKNLGYPVVCSNAIALAVGHTGGLVDLGEQSVKGRSALHVWGWNPPLVQRIQKDGL